LKDDEKLPFFPSISSSILMKWIGRTFISNDEFISWYKVEK
jgi:hypothetical protein